MSGESWEVERPPLQNGAYRLVSSVWNPISTRGDNQADWRNRSCWPMGTKFYVYARYYPESKTEVPALYEGMSVRYAVSQFFMPEILSALRPYLEKL